MSRGEMTEVVLNTDVKEAEDWVVEDDPSEIVMSELMNRCEMTEVVLNTHDKEAEDWVVQDDPSEVERSELMNRCEMTEIVLKTHDKEAEDCIVLDDLFEIVETSELMNRCESTKKALETDEEDAEDCIIQEFDLCEIVEMSELTLQQDSSKLEGSESSDEDVIIVAAKGLVACRDYPHPRHLCATYPFKDSSSDIHCKMCYCYVCEVPAPCEEWTEVSSHSELKHCDATADNALWKSLRDVKKQLVE